MGLFKLGGGLYPSVDLCEYVIKLGEVGECRWASVVPLSPSVVSLLSLFVIG